MVSEASILRWRTSRRGHCGRSFPIEGAPSCPCYSPSCFVLCLRRPSRGRAAPRVCTRRLGSRRGSRRPHPEHCFIRSITRFPSHQADSADGLRNRFAGLCSVCLSVVPPLVASYAPRWYLLVIPSSIAALAAEVMMGALHKMLSKAAPGDTCRFERIAWRGPRGRARGVCRGPGPGRGPLRGFIAAAGGAAPFLRAGRLAFAFCAAVALVNARLASALPPWPAARGQVGLAAAAQPGVLSFCVGRRGSPSSTSPFCGVPDGRPDPGLWSMSGSSVTCSRGVWGDGDLPASSFATCPGWSLPCNDRADALVDLPVRFLFFLASCLSENPRVRDSWSRAFGGRARRAARARRVRAPGTTS